MKRTFRSLLVLALLCARVAALTLGSEEIGISKKIPKEWDRVIWQVPIRNEAQEPFEGEIRLQMRWARREEPLSDPVSQSARLRLTPAQSQDVIFEWMPPRNDDCRVLFELEDEVGLRCAICGEGRRPFHSPNTPAST